MKEGIDESMNSAKRRVIGSIVLQVEKQSAVGFAIYQSLSKGVIIPTKLLMG